MANNTGTFFNINDNDGIPLVGVSTNGKVMINHLYGNCLIGSTSVTGTTSQPLQVTGGAYVSGNLGIGTASPTYKLDVFGEGRFTKVITPEINSGGANYVYFENTGIRVDGDGTFDGSVGIGTTSPAEIFHVNAPSNALAVIRLSGSASSQTPFNIRQGIVGTSNAGFSIYDVNNSATRFAIDSSGNLGIGTNSPGSKLHVYGLSDSTFTGLPANVTLANPGTIAAGLGAGIWFAANYDNTINTTYAVISGARENATSGNTAGYLAFGVRDSGGGTSIERMRITSGGNVGIGLTTPNNKLDVIGNTYISGNLGIGTTNPDYNLDVQGTQNVTDQISLWGRTIGQPQTLIEPGKIYATSAGLGPGNLLLQPTGGNLGIGTTNPTSKLQVIGDARVGINTSQGVILTAENGTKYRLIVSTAGVLSTVLVP